MAYTPLFNTFESEYQMPLSPVKATGTSSSSGTTSTPGAGIVASGVLSGLADIATGFISAQRVKNTYKFNAAMAQLQGRMTRLAADVEIKNIRKRAQSLFSSQVAAYAKAGVKPFLGSAAVVMVNSLKEAELDAIYADISAEYNVGLTQTQAGIYQMQGKSAQIDAWINAFRGILNIGVKQYTRG